MTTTLKIVIPALLLGLSSPRLAAAATSDGETPATAVATPSNQTPGVAADPNADRAFILPTAMTQPGHSATYNNYELLLHGLTYGITDRVQTTVTVLSPIVKDMPFLGIAAVKWRFLATQRFHMALQGSAGLGHFFDSSSSNSNGYTLGGGAFATACLREDCSSILSASATYQHFFSGNNDGSLVIYGGSLVHGVSQHVKLLAEVASAAASGGSSDFNNMPGALVGYGARLHTGNIASDIGFIRPVGEDTGDFLLGLPFVNVSYRWQ